MPAGTAERGSPVKVETQGLEWRDVTRTIFASGLTPSRGMAVNRSWSVPSTGSGPIVLNPENASGRGYPRTRA